MQISTPSVISRDICLENRSDRCLCWVPDIQLGRPGSGVAALFIGDYYACCPKPFVIGAFEKTSIHLPASASWHPFATRRLHEQVQVRVPPSVHTKGPQLGAGSSPVHSGAAWLIARGVQGSWYWIRVRVTGNQGYKNTTWAPAAGWEPCLEPKTSHTMYTAS